MRRSLGTLLIAAVLGLGLSACGSDNGDSAADPVETSTRSTTPTGQPPGTTGEDQTQPGGSDGPGYEVIGLYSATAAGGTATDQLTAIGTDAELEAYVAQFRGPTLGDKIRAAARGAEGDGELMAAVVGLGCDIPPGVEVAPAGDTFTVQPQKVTDPLAECLAAVTTVVVISVGT